MYYSVKNKNHTILANIVPFHKNVELHLVIIKSVGGGLERENKLEMLKFCDKEYINEIPRFCFYES